MEESGKKYQEECLSHFNEIGLFADTKVCRLIGFADDGEDYYWIVQEPDLRGNHKKVYCSMVGPWVSLKGIYPRYNALEHQFTHIWDCPPQEKFEVDIQFSNPYGTP